MLFYNKRIFERCFSWRGRYWYKNIAEIPLYFKQMHHLIKHGYDVEAEWETFGWFMDMMKKILPAYLDPFGIGIVIEGYPYEPVSAEEAKEWDEKNSEYWKSIIQRMLDLLDLMDECNPKYDAPEYDEDLWRADREMNAAKDEFFQLFAKYFYYLWD